MRMDPGDSKLPSYNHQLLYSDRCPSPEVIYPYPLYKDPAMEKLKLAHLKQNQVGDDGDLCLELTPLLS